MDFFTNATDTNLINDLPIIPNAPTNIRFTFIKNVGNILWDAPIENGSNIIGYQIYNNNILQYQTFNLLARSAPITFIFNIPHSFTVAAMYESGNVISSPFTINVNEHSAPSNVFMNVVNNVVNITWDKPINNDSVVSYEIRNKMDVLESFNSLVNSTTITLINNKNYSLDLATIHNEDRTYIVPIRFIPNTSNTLNALPIIPNAPTNIRFTFIKNVGNILWDAPIENGSNIIGYQIYNNNILQYQTFNLLARSAPITFIFNIPHSFTVAAMYEGGNVISSPFTINVNEPSAPSNVFMNVVNNVVNVTWDKPINNDSVVSYNVKNKDNILQSFNSEAHLLNSTTITLINNNDYSLDLETIHFKDYKNSTYIVPIRFIPNTSNTLNALPKLNFNTIKEDKPEEDNSNIPTSLPVRPDAYLPGVVTKEHNFKTHNYPSIYSIFHSILALFAIYLSFKCNKGFSFGSFFMAIFFPYIYIIYKYATTGSFCNIDEIDEIDESDE